MTIMKAEPARQENHPNQIFSQIILPFLLFFALVVCGGYFLFSRLVSGSADFRMWSDISVVIIFLPLIFIGPILLVIFMAKIALVSAIQEKVQGFFGKVSPVILKITRSGTHVAQFLAKPFVAINTGLSFLKSRK